MPQRIKREYLKMLWGNTRLKKEIASTGKKAKSVHTVNKWFRLNEFSGPLTNIENLTLISKTLNIPIKQLLEESHETDKHRKRSCVPAFSG